jgi:peptidoglycan/xylan/chitin deacetylase (PgdA/CDA1 family)
VAIAGGNEIRVKTGIVEIDTTGGPGFGFEHFKQYDLLRDKEFGFEHLKQYDFLREIVLTFDDGPWPERRIAE